MARFSQTGNRAAGTIGCRAMPRLHDAGYHLDGFGGVYPYCRMIAPDGTVIIEKVSREKAIEAGVIHHKNATR